MIDNIDDNHYDTMTGVTFLSPLSYNAVNFSQGEWLGVVPSLGRFNVVKLIHWKLGGMYDLNLDRKNKQTYNWKETRSCDTTATTTIT